MHYCAEDFLEDGRGISKQSETESIQQGGSERSSSEASDGGSQGTEQEKGDSETLANGSGDVSTEATTENRADAAGSDTGKRSPKRSGSNKK